ncbi:MAG: hypothetical protein HY819_17310 [Acidobacteria bacterium]|nr:hypothetical protein [Acidobacteriota bacterium]
MIEFPRVASNEEIKSIMELWVSFLIKEDYQAASEMLFIKDKESVWTANILKSYIIDYWFGDKSSYKVVSIENIFSPGIAKQWFYLDRSVNFDALDPQYYVGMLQLKLTYNDNISQLTIDIGLRKVAKDYVALELLDFIVT